MKTRGGIAAIALIALISLFGCDWLFPPAVPPVGFAPLAGAVATQITIVGTGFGATPAGAVVSFAGVAAPIVAWSETNVVVRIPLLATPAGWRLVTVELGRAGVLLGAGQFTVVRGVLFESNRDGNNEIYVMNPDGSQPINLTNHAGNDSSPIWSPDGMRIAFVSSRDGNSEIYAMNADGSGLANLTNHPSTDSYPVWSPRGDKIAFVTDRESGLGPLDTSPKIIMTYNTEIFVMNADGTGQSNLTNDPGRDAYPSWSPDGTRISFQTDRDDTPVVPLGILPDGFGIEIYSMHADGSHPVRLSWSPEDDLYPTWSPDGDKILFQSYRDGNAEIYTMNEDGSGQTRLTNHPEPDMFPTWSPRGTRITFHSDRDGNSEIYRMNADGSSQMRLTTSIEWDGCPSWSPDGSQIAFESYRDGNLEIYRMNADGSFQTRLTSQPGWDFHPAWGTSGPVPMP